MSFPGTMEHARNGIPGHAALAVGVHLGAAAILPVRKSIIGETC